jgi:hypothetical protein
VAALPSPLGRKQKVDGTESFLETKQRSTGMGDSYSTNT